MNKLVKKIKINTSITLVTGLHIGGSKDNIEIGGIDSPVIKIATDKGKPYIPGSSLKGKMRCLLEQTKGKLLGGDLEINSVFGYTDDKSISKILVRDAYLREESVLLLENCQNLDTQYTENKYENKIDRHSGTTIKGGIRQIERIPAGVSFDVEFIVNVWETESGNIDEDLSLTLLQKGINALENDYLGGSGSRGYGQIKFGELKYSHADETTEWKMVEGK
jgi:CRISPR-associated protein Csm3